jgi:hypothetical protein
MSVRAHTHSWTDGAPTERGANVTSGVYAVGGSMKFTVPASATEAVLRVRFRQRYHRARRAWSAGVSWRVERWRHLHGVSRHRSFVHGRQRDGRRTRAGSCLPASLAEPLIARAEQSSNGIMNAVYTVRFRAASATQLTVQWEQVLQRWAAARRCAHCTSLRQTSGSGGNVAMQAVTLRQTGR